MTDAEVALMAKYYRGERITHADICSTITSKTELAAYRAALVSQGALTSEAVTACLTRENELNRGRS